MHNVIRWSEAGAEFSGNACGFGVDSDDNRLYINRGAGREAISTNKVLTPTAALTLTSADDGAEVFLNAAAGFAITLPSPAAALKFRFTVAASFATTNFTVVSAGGSNIIQGGATVAGADVPAADEDTISFVATAETKGDFVDVWSDGTSWFVNGRGTTSGSITFTAS
jgi:hypothetical protein